MKAAREAPSPEPGTQWGLRKSGSPAPLLNFQNGGVILAHAHAMAKTSPCPQADVHTGHWGGRNYYRTPVHET